MWRMGIVNSTPNFLVAITGLGSSGQSDVSIRDEEILQAEIDPIYGWMLKPDDMTAILDTSFLFALTD
jgi:hypothetical protein